MEFAKRQLEKYGWSQGQGLGKDNDGRPEPIKVKIKRDNKGVGFPPGGDVCNDWWYAAFNTAASQIKVDQYKETVSISTGENSIANGLRSHCYDNHRRSLLLGRFEPSKMTHIQNKMEKEEKGEEEKGKGEKEEGKEEEKEKRKKEEGKKEERKEEEVVRRRVRRKRSLPNSEDLRDPVISDRRWSLSDEDLLKACGGRTAHKAARHGLKLSGKLKRIQEQDNKLLAMHGNASKLTSMDLTKQSSTSTTP